MVDEPIVFRQSFKAWLLAWWTVLKAAFMKPYETTYIDLTTGEELEPAEIAGEESGEEDQL